MQGKVCLVTGANGSLGKATAIGLARQGATVLLTCRDQARGEAALAEVKGAARDGEVALFLVDLASQASVRAGADAVLKQYDRLDVLVHNAAVYKQQRVLTADGLEMMFATNHLGPFLLTHLLLERLKASTSAGAPVRILTVTAPSTTPLNFDDLQGERRFNALSAFGASKMCNLLFTYELARRLADAGVTANAVYPGLVKSSLMREAAAPVRWVTSLVSSPPARAADGLVYLASSPAVEGTTGQFFKGQQNMRSNAYSHDASAQQRLWDVSMRLTGLG